MAGEEDEATQKSRISDLRNALMEGHSSEVIRLCSDVPNGPLEIINVYDDTVIHAAARSRLKDLTLDLVKTLPRPGDPDYRQLSGIKNADGNTLLHEVATGDEDMKKAAEELLERDPDLVTNPNKLGETPIFCAARYGQTQMFEFLAVRMKLEERSPEEGRASLQRYDGRTLLHISIISECFDLALFIAKSYPYLIEQRDKSLMTALQYLACNPTAFRRGETQIRRGFIGLLNESKIEARGLLADLFDVIFEAFYEKSNDSLQELVRLLVEKDTSWDANIISQAKNLYEGDKEPEKEEFSSKLSRKWEGQHNSQKSSIHNKKKSDESALFLATTSNIQQIVEEVLKSQPEALKHTNKEGMNILHVAILYRHIDIFDMVVKHEMVSSRLLSTTDNEGNSVLHMVCQKRKSQASEKMQGPALQLQDELLLFEKVKSACKNLITNPLNNDNKTAEELFAVANEQLHQEAKEWLMRTTENCTILSVFIATVAFAAVYTVPGGPNQDIGIPILHSKPFFLVFTLADVISLALALTSVGIFLSILTSSFPLQDFKIYLFKKLRQGIVCLVLSVSMMAVAFGATVALMMSHNRGDVIWSVVGFLPVPIFFLSYSPLRLAVLEPCREWCKIFLMNIFTIFMVILTVLIFGVYEGLKWTMKKAGSLLFYWVRSMTGFDLGGSSHSDESPIIDQIQLEHASLHAHCNSSC